MEPIQINVTVKLDDATQAFLSSLFRSTAKPAAAFAPVEQPKPVPAKPAEQPKPAPAKPAAAAPAAASAQSSITIDSLRELAITKMNAHRVEIKQKLTELGTPSITKLDVSKYQEMYDFLKGLE
jgi:hypothetical protein